MRMYGRIAICGVMADYDVPFEQLAGIRNMYFVLIRQLRIQGFLAGFTDQEWIDHLAALHDLFDRGLIHSRPHIVHGFESAPEHLALLFSGGNAGKLMVQVSPEPAVT
jgi:NADPH-dependent curcumin reductase CurA